MSRSFAFALVAFAACAPDLESDQTQQQEGDNDVDPELGIICPSANVSSGCMRVTPWSSTSTTVIRYWPQVADGGVPQNATSSQVIVTAGRDLDVTTGNKTVFVWIVGEGSYVSRVYEVQRPQYNGMRNDLELDFEAAISSNPTQMFGQVQVSGGLAGNPIPHPTPGGDPPQFSATYVNDIILTGGEYISSYRNNVLAHSGVGSLLGGGKTRE